MAHPKLSPISIVFFSTVAALWVVAFIAALNIKILAIAMIIATPLFAMLLWEMAKEDAYLTEKLEKKE